MIPKNDFFVVFSFAACLVALLCAAVLISFSKTNRFSNRLLAFGLMGLGAIVFTNTLNYTDLFIRFPHLFRATFPLHYAIPPIFYLYVRSALFNEKRFRRFDWVLFVPACLHLLEFMPYYMLGANEKIEMLKNLYKDPAKLADHSQGLLPPLSIP
ncbi:hypothetical protein POV26_09055 [Aequorivita todarodis]|uniref:hypothetical protein n=1 Tax=Aequorivita todarodis TaxID=2036821 RepID=UPI00234FCC1D|nr:hypothetical protein [Aequorivita todarodis]MDC8001185.1 hypothetical protein [Aequorivita todarodis]